MGEVLKGGRKGGQLGFLPGPRFNRSLRVEVKSDRVSDNAGAVLLREALERSELLTLLDEAIEDPRNPLFVTHPQRELLATTLLLLALGWQDQDDADALRKDPVLRLCVSQRKGASPLRDDPGQEDAHNPDVPQGLASQPTLSRLVARLAEPERLDRLREVLRHSAARRVRAMNGGRRLAQVTLDVDGVGLEVHGHQPGSLYNGYFERTVYHPLVTTAAELGDLIAVRLRHGTAGAAFGALEAALEDVEFARKHLGQQVSLRFDAGFPDEHFLGGLERVGVPYVGRLRGNAVLDRLATPLLKRPVGRPPDEPRTWHHELEYQAESWSRPRRVVLVVQERPDELLLHHFFLVTSWPCAQRSGEELHAHYSRRGSAEATFGEFKDVLAPKLSSAPRGERSEDWRSKIHGPVRPCDDPFFRANDARLILCALAANLLHMLRTLLERHAPEAGGWSLRRLRERVLRVAARVTVHSRRVAIVVAQASARYWVALWHEWHHLELPAPPG